MSTGLRLTVAEYDRMVEKGAFDELSQKVELIYGEIQAMNPADPVHDDYIQYLNEWSIRNTLDAEISVRVQSGLSLKEQDSRPEPDLLWVVAGRYVKAHPTAAETLLAIEVSYSSLKSDQEVKERLYAEAEIAEYWIVDVQKQVVHVHRQPVGGSYESVTEVKAVETLSPLAKPGAVLVLKELFAAD